MSKELNAKIVLKSNGGYDIFVQESEDFYLGVEPSDLKKMAEAYSAGQKKKKEQLKKDVETSKGLTKKAVVKAFLKKTLRKKMAGKNNLRVLAQTVEAGKKALKDHSRAFSRAEADADRFWALVEKNLAPDTVASESYKFLRDWFLDLLTHEVSAGRATDYSDAPKDYIEDILSGIHRAATKSAGKMVKVWEQDVDPPYSSRVSREDIEKFLDLFPTMSVDDEIESQGDGDDEDEPYNYKIFVTFPKK